MSQPKLILVKHSLPFINPELPPNKWKLSTEGEKRCILLAQQLSPYLPLKIFSSRELKAIQTAEILSHCLGLSSQVENGLHEHERPEPGLLSVDEFEERVKSLFASPESNIFGSETALQAQARFYESVMQLTTQHTGATILVVSHGTVISLFLQMVCQVEPFKLWKSLGLPSFIVLSLPDYRLEITVPSIISQFTSY